MISETIQAIIPPHVKDLGEGVMIKRLLPGSPRNVGPFIFFDFMSDLKFKKGTGMDVRPHPHIGLSTLTYLIKGQNHHRDSINNDIIVSSGDILLMTSGHGIVHSERSPEEVRLNDHDMHGFQFWLALPEDKEEIDPSIVFAKNHELPLIELNDKLQARLAMGSFKNTDSPVQSFFSPLLIDIITEENGNFEFDTENRELGIFLEHGEISIDGKTFNSHEIILFKKNSKVKVEYKNDSHLIIFGGDSLDSQKHIWWNLVSADQNKIDQAKLRWKNGQFPAIPGEIDFIPLPE